MFVTLNTLISQGLYDKAPLEQHYSSSVSRLVARLLIPDPERRPSAREVLEILTVQEKPVSVTMTSLGLWDDPLGFQRDQLPCPLTTPPTLATRLRLPTPFWSTEASVRLGEVMGSM